MKKEYQVAAYLTKEEHEKLKGYISQNTNGDNTSVSTYLRKLILHHINTQPLSTSPSPPAVAPITESSQRLSLSDLDW
jgi:hypothetical protein